MIKNPHDMASSVIVQHLLKKITEKPQRYILSMAGESGCGKTETSKALINELANYGIKAIVIGQDNYFHLPPAENDAMRKQHPEWLGPHKEVNMTLLNTMLGMALTEATALQTLHIDYETNQLSEQKTDIAQVKVIIVEGTYTSLLKNVDARIFIDQDYHQTLIFRKIRNRGNEVNDPFVENILETEHKIIAGHKYLADFIITPDYEVIIT